MRSAILPAQTGASWSQFTAMATLFACSIMGAGMKFAVAARRMSSI